MATLSSFETGQQRISTPNAATGGVGGFSPVQKKTKDLSGTINSILGNVSNIAGSIAGQMESERQEALQLNVNTAQSIGLKHSRQLNAKMIELDTAVSENKLDRRDAIKQLNDYNVEVSLIGSDGLSSEAKEAYERTYLNSSIVKINTKSTGWAKEQIKIDQNMVLTDTQSAINELGSGITTEELSALKQGLVNAGLDDSKVEASAFNVMQKSVEGKYSVDPISFYKANGKFLTDQQVKDKVYSNFAAIVNTNDKAVKGAIDKTVGKILSDKQTYQKEIVKPSQEDYFKIKQILENGVVKSGASGTNVDIKKLLSPKQQSMISYFSASQKNTIGNLTSNINGNNNARTIVMDNAKVLYSGNVSKAQTNLFKNVLVNGRVINYSDNSSFKVTAALANAELKKIQERQDNQFASFNGEMNNNVLSQYATYAKANQEIDKQSEYTKKVNNRMTTNNFAAYKNAEEIVNESNMYKINSTISKTNEDYSVFLSSRLKQTYDAVKGDLLKDNKYSKNGELNTEGKKALLNQVISAKTSVIKSVFNNKYISNISKWSVSSMDELKNNYINENISIDTISTLKDHIVRKAIKLDSQEEYKSYAKDKLVSTRGFFSNLSSVIPFTDTNYMVLAPEGTNESEVIGASSYFVKNILKAEDMDDYSFSNTMNDAGDIMLVVERKSENGERDRSYTLSKEDITNLASKDMRNGWASTIRTKLRIKD